jgi:hypothetical protein
VSATIGTTSRCCQVCGEDFVQGPTALDRERFQRAICGGCDRDLMTAFEQGSAQRIAAPVLVSESSMAAFEHALDHPPPATPALRALFQADRGADSFSIDAVRQELAALPPGDVSIDRDRLIASIDVEIRHRNRLAKALIELRDTAVQAVKTGKLPHELWARLTAFAVDGLTRPGAGPSCDRQESLLDEMLAQLEAQPGGNEDVVIPPALLDALSEEA